MNFDFMEELAAKNDILQQLQKEILLLQGYKTTLSSQRIHTGLGPIEKAFHDNTFPIGVVHEFLSLTPQDAAATSGFIAGLLGTFMKRGGTCLWIGTKRTIFPPALKLFGINPEHIIFVDLNRDKDVLWAIEEALKCKSVAAVVGELSAMSFSESRRLQLAVEESKVTGFIHCYQPKSEGTTACVSRWKIRPLSSVPEDGMPGVGFPRWNVQLLKIRNGKPGAWQVEWASGKFHIVPVHNAIAITSIRKAV